MRTKTAAMGYIFHKGRCLLVKHRKTGRYMSCGGHIEDGELVEEALKREIREELNLDIDIVHNRRFSSLDFELCSPYLVCSKILSEDERIQIFEYVCLADDIKDMRIDFKELDGYRLFSREEIRTSENIPDTVKEIVLSIFESFD